MERSDLQEVHRRSGGDDAGHKKGLQGHQGREGCREGHLQDAKVGLSRCLEQQPDFPWPRLLRGFAAMELREFKAARADFDAALALYETRPDKEYSLIDCRSMVALRALGVTEVLTNDHHFTQEGFTILFPTP